ncbi:MAG: hypothetical protein AUK63_144 [bacterium P3]|nr:MAG: hypothetical protein AUK63_144 [bacterium P3]
MGALVSLMAGCAKEEQSNSDPVKKPGAIVLNEGNMGSNNAALSVLDLDNGKADNMWFQNANGRKLGDQAQDMILYGSKVYITVTESNTLEVLDPATGISTRKSMGSLKPRYIAAHNGKVYVTCYNPPCVVCIDTATLAIEDTCRLGDYRPEGIAIAQGKAFVAGAYHKNDYNRFDNKIYVVDLTVFDTMPSIAAGSNNNRIELVDENTLVINHGNGTTASPSGMFFLNTATCAVTAAGCVLTRMTVYNGKVYGFHAPYGGTPSFVVVNCDGSVEDFPFTPAFEDMEQNENPYGIHINPYNGDLYITTDGSYRVPGDIYCFRPDGSLRFKTEAGMFPSKILFLTM